MSILRRSGLASRAVLLGIACTLVACGSASQEAGASGSGAASGSTGTGTGTGAGGDGVCTPGMPPYDGPLCGLPDLPCVARADETLEGTDGGMGASIAVDGTCTPHMAFELPDETGQYAHREGAGTWSVETLPFTLPTPGIAVRPDGTPFVLAGDPSGATAGTLWSKAGAQWAEGEAMPTKGNAGALLYGSDDAFHTVVRPGVQSLEHARYGRGWTVSALGAEATLDAGSIALSTGGEAHFAFWGAGTDGEALLWLSAPGAPELVAYYGPTGSSGASSRAMHPPLAVSAPDSDNPSGQPHILFVRASGQDHEIASATRQGPGAWSVTTIDTEKPGVRCDKPPTAPDQTCAYDYEELDPFGAVTTPSGVVRFVYGKMHFEGTQMAVCQGPEGGPPCTAWGQPKGTSDGRLLIGWIDGGGKAGHVEVGEPLGPDGGGVPPEVTVGAVALDALGDIHVAIHNGYGTAPRYVRIGL